ncbi:hypothetical protein FQN54_007748 [Arachnomyces sp. PD_36]|nr:hypothetical protein FQN54_007748 [Arachnomyces sp. PD_36]
MASLRRSKTMPADGQTAKFLYTILKQLDMKSVDWNLVASQLEITNGHAARMRFSRFKQHMEGTTTTPRTPRPKKSKNEKAEAKKRGLEEPTGSPGKKPCCDNSELAVKVEAHSEGNISAGAPIKMEPATHPYPLMTVAPSDLAMNGAQNPTPVLSQPQPPASSGWPVIKLEPEERTLDGTVVKTEPTF